MILQISVAIEQRNRVSFLYKEKKYKVEIYVLGLNAEGVMAIRAYNLNDRKFKLFFVEFIKDLVLIKWSKFYINRINYNPYSDSYFNTVILKV